MCDKKILYLIASSEIGGTERMLLLLASRIRTAGFAPVIVGLRGPGAFTEAVRKEGIPLYVLSCQRNPAAFFSLIGLLRKEQPALLHTFLYVANIAGRIAGRLAGVPAVISSQRSTDPWRRWYHWKLDALTAPLAATVVSNSYAGKNALVEHAVTAPRRITVIPNGIDTSRVVVPAAKEDFGARAALVVSVGNLRTPKGHTYLLRAAPRVLREFPETVFVIVGEGPLRAALEREAAALGISGRVVFTGYRADPERIIAAGDAFALPSLWEGCPVALLEAMFCGRACIASSVGDVPSIIGHGENGLVVPPAAPEAIADALIAVLGDGALRKRLGEAAARTVRERYSLEAMISAYIKVYKGFLRGCHSCG